MKRKKLEEFLDLNSRGEKLDGIMRELLEEKFDTELKARYSETLASKYKIERHESGNGKPRIPRSKFKTILVCLLAIAAVSAGAFWMTKQMSMEQDRVQQYLADNTLRYQGAFRNDNAVLSPERSEAYQAFNEGKYEAFVDLILRIEVMTLEDRFFQAYALMVMENYADAASQFDSISREQEPSEKYYQETTLYHMICLMQVDQTAFQNMYDSLDVDSWVKAEIHKILD